VSDTFCILSISIVHRKYIEYICFASIYKPEKYNSFAKEKLNFERTICIVSHTNILDIYTYKVSPLQKSIQLSSVIRNNRHDVLMSLSSIL
jgi:hypothetical protein